MPRNNSLISLALWRKPVVLISLYVQFWNEKVLWVLAFRSTVFYFKVKKTHKGINSIKISQMQKQEIHIQKHREK